MGKDTRGKAPAPRMGAKASGKPKAVPEKKKKSTAPAESGVPAKKTPKGPGKAKPEKGLQKREKLQAELVQELSQLRENLAVTALAVKGRLDAELAGVLSAFEGQGIPGEPERLPQARVQAVMVMALKDLKIKPEKGRLKDLGRIADLASRLAELMPQGS